MPESAAARRLGGSCPWSRAGRAAEEGCAEPNRSIVPDGGRGRGEISRRRLSRRAARRVRALRRDRRAIPLEELKYWGVDLQDPYANPEAVLQRHVRKRAHR